MRSLAILLAAVFVLSGCNSEPVGTAPVHQGRYLGVGVYSVGNMWSRMKAPAPADKSAATLADDEHVIVVVDSHTGEVRQCGDLSGYCIRTNPWTATSASNPTALTEHAAQIAAEAANNVVDPLPAKR